MTMMTRTFVNNDILQETAARLIHILGVDKAIYTCCSNDWHGVLSFVLAYKRSLGPKPCAFGLVRSDRRHRHHGVSQTVTNRRHLIPKTASPAIAA